jgi:hypothetical protein
MWAALLAAATLAAPPGELSARIAASAAAAQALQGPIDGTWVLRDRGGHVLYTLQITDPAGGGPPQAAWLARGASAPVERIARSAGRLSLAFHGERVRLQRRPGGEWSGVMTAKGRNVAVTMRRPPQPGRS